MIEWTKLVLTEEIVNIGQIPPQQIKELRRMARKGLILQWQGYWSTKDPRFGFGPLKTCWGPI